MLKKYGKYLNLEDEEVLNENHIKPDPKGVNKIYDSKSYHKEFNTILTDAMAKVKKDAAEAMVEKLKKDITGKLISLTDENGRQKILEVNNVIVGSKGGDYYPVIEEDKDKKVRYPWEKDSKIFDVGKFLEFFEEHYLDQLLMFQGRSVKGGEQMKYMKHVIRIGVHNGSTQDFLIVENDDKTSQLLDHTSTIKILDMKLKELDPYGEENWEN